MDADEMRALIRRMYSAFNGGDLDAAQAMFADDFFSHPLGTTGLAPVRAAWESMRRRYPGLRVTADDIVVEGDRMAVRSTVSNVGEQGEPMLVEFLRVRDGRIAELWGLTALQRG